MTDDDADQFDRAHPGVYDAFRRMAWAWAQRSKRGSARYLVHKIRWETRLGTFRENELKVNDHWSTPLAKRFMAEFPQYRDFFQTRAKALPTGHWPEPRPAFQRERAASTPKPLFTQEGG